MGPVIKSFDVEGGQASKNAKAKHAGDIWPTSAPFQTRKPGIRFARVGRRGGVGEWVGKAIASICTFWLPASRGSSRASERET